MPPKKAASTSNKRKSTDNAPAPEAKRSRTKDPKASHLYTDDNPETTLHGTGFKDKATALHTIELVSQRSVTYQFQTINTMLYRARGHAHKTSGIEDAIKIFQEWVDGYRGRKAELRQFPLLSKPKVKTYLERFDDGDFGVKKELQEVHGLKEAEEFARMYVDLGARKRLANTLVDNKKPEGEDWEVRRYKHLCSLVKEGRKWETGELWLDERERRPTGEHLVMILWGYSPSKKT
ncbi:hypothetical protein BDZ85DRAFT_264441 [Elsinoe ampelina]|uniref:Uncharacterized protein n=1 Tax=Elsinoe ampelina TaxID=302913 RepID=A0A6A6G824_9PEZI|nr:hypothetical protein BDZ85DRAFT_264441 [Elsinoe ampelina]